MKPYTDEQHVESCGMLCPYCRSVHVVMDAMDFDTCNIDLGRVYLPVRCESCGKDWVNLFDIKGWIK